MHTPPLGMPVGCRAAVAPAGENLHYGVSTVQDYLWGEAPRADKN